MTAPRLLLLALLGAATSADVGRADLLTTFNGTTPSVDVSAVALGQTFNVLPVGPFQFTVNAGSPDPTFAPNSTFRAFCSELTQDVSLNGNYAFTVVPPASLPTINNDAAKLALVTRLFNRYYGSATDATNGGAFQLSLWEVLYDGPGHLNLNAGNVNVTSPDSIPAVALAKSWLSTLETPLPTDTNTYQLVGLDSETAQDQLTVVPSPVPAPAGVVLGLIALAGFGARRLRRGS